jgi:hypothetical protein
MDHIEEPTGAEDESLDRVAVKPSGTFLSWPPPGLEAAQGRLLSPIALITIGDVILILPLLWSAATEQPVSSFGPFGNSWWIPIITTGIGLLTLLYGFGRLIGLLRLAAKAGGQGHGWLMVVQVAADFSRDTGFLLQGARLYAETASAKRGLMLATRMVGAVAYLLAALWVPFGFVVSLLLGTRGLLNPAGVWFLTVAPAALLLLVALLSRLLGRKFSWDAKRNRGLRTAVDQEVRALVSEWNQRSALVRTDLGISGAISGHAKYFRTGGVVVVLIAALVLVPVITVTMTGAVGTVLAAIAVPGYDNAQARVAAAEMLRRYKLSTDGSVTPREAGEALHALLSATEEASDRVLEQAPIRIYEQPWFPEDTDSVMGGSSGDWALGLFARIRDGLERGERDYLATVAAHPAHVEFRTIAMADSVDIIGTRYALPFPDTVNPFALPIPHFRGIADGTNAHIALAAWELARGNRTRAEELLREIISVGFILMDEGSTLLDGMIGTRLVFDGAEALEQLYGASGREVDAENLGWLRSGIDVVLERSSVTRARYAAQGALQMMPNAVLNEQVLRGLRWEYFLTFATLAPCVNLNNVVFGPGESFEQWLEEAEQALVRRPSDEAMFRFLQEGWFRGGSAVNAPIWVRAALRMTFGGSLGGTCAAQVGGMDMVGVMQ